MLMVQYQKLMLFLLTPLANPCLFPVQRQHRPIILLGQQEHLLHLQNLQGHSRHHLQHPRLQPRQRLPLTQGTLSQIRQSRPRKALRFLYLIAAGATLAGEFWFSSPRGFSKNFHAPKRTPAIPRLAAKRRGLKSSSCRLASMP